MTSALNLSHTSGPVVQPLTETGLISIIYHLIRSRIGCFIWVNEDWEDWTHCCWTETGSRDVWTWTCLCPRHTPARRASRWSCAGRSRSPGCSAELRHQNCLMTDERLDQRNIGGPSQFTASLSPCLFSPWLGCTLLRVSSYVNVTPERAWPLTWWCSMTPYVPPGLLPAVHWTCVSEAADTLQASWFMVTEMSWESFPNPKPVRVRTEPLGPVGRKQRGGHGTGGAQD